MVGYRRKLLVFETGGLQMSHPLYRVTNFSIVAEYTLRVRFDDDSEQTIDFRPVLYGEAFGPLRDLALFNQVTLDPIARTLTWPNGADFDPETLRNWPAYIEELAARAKQWDTTPASAG
jgi:hypothetical protein